MKNFKNTAKYDPQEQRILDILQARGPEQTGVTNNNLFRFYEYLIKTLKLPLKVTGMEDTGCFAWEEKFSWGEGDKDEYNRLKKTRPSYTDTYDLVEITETYSLEEGLEVKVKRISDNRIFQLPLADLEAVNTKSSAARLLDDYSVWFVNEGL